MTVNEIKSLADSTNDADGIDSLLETVKSETLSRLENPQQAYDFFYEVDDYVFAASRRVFGSNDDELVRVQRRMDRIDQEIAKKLHS